MAQVTIRNAIVQSPEWWLGRLYGKLVGRRPDLVTLDDYYEGNQTLRLAMERWRKAFGNQFRHFSENVCPLVVDSVEERLDVIGFRIDDDTSTQAWDIWQRNRMDAESQIAHSEALILGSSYGMVWNTDAASDQAQLTVESAHNTIVEHVPGSRWERAAALKSWRDDWTGRINATLYLPDSVYKFQTDKPVDESASTSSDVDVNWETREPQGEDWPLSNPFGIVPVVPLYNRPRLRKPARSEITDVIPSQDAINKLTMDMLVAAEFAAFRQRVIIGVEEPTDPETGQVIKDYWKQALEAFLIIPNNEAKVDTIDATDLNNYVVAIEHEIQKVATRSQTPPHYFFLRGAFPSGESIVAAEAGLVSKARRRMRHWSDGWEEIVALALRVEGQTVEPAGIDTLWRDPESRTEGQHIDAVGKKREMLDVPLEQAWEDAGYSPTQIDRMRKLREAEKAAEPPAPPPPVPPVGQPGPAQGA